MLLLDCLLRIWKRKDSAVDPGMMMMVMNKRRTHWLFTLPRCYQICDGESVWVTLAAVERLLQKQGNCTGQEGNRMKHFDEALSISSLTPKAGRRPAETSCPRWAPWIRWRWTSSLAEGSVQKWSDVFSLVYSKAQGPTEDAAQKQKSEEKKKNHLVFEHLGNGEAAMGTFSEGMKVWKMCFVNKSITSKRLNCIVVINIGIYFNVRGALMSVSVTVVLL